MMKECSRSGSAGSRWTLRKRENELVARVRGASNNGPALEPICPQGPGRDNDSPFSSTRNLLDKIEHCAELGRRPSEGESAFPIMRFLDRVRRTRNRNQ